MTRFHCLLIAVVAIGCEPGVGGVDMMADEGTAADLGTATTTTIRIHYPAEGHSISLRGDSAPLNWDKGISLASSDGSTFSYVFASPPNKEVQFKPLLDDTTWSRGANYRVVPGASVDVYPHFFANKGKVVDLFASFHSTL